MTIQYWNQEIKRIQFWNTEIKSVRKGNTKIRPKQNQIILDSDLTTATLASLQSQGWTDIASTSNRWYRLDSTYWLRAADTWTDTYCSLYYDCQSIVNDIKTIEREADVYWVYASWSGWQRFGIYDTLFDESYWCYWNSWFNNNSWWKNQSIWVNGTDKVLEQIGLNTWDYSFRMSTSFETWVITKTVLQWSNVIVSQTYTLTQSEINTIKSRSKYIFAKSWFWTRTNWSNNSIKRVKLTINF